jgi:hypothetical protein
MLSLLLLACTDDLPPPTTWGTDDTATPTHDSATDTGWPHDTAFDDATAPQDITAEIVDEVVTVVRVSWTTDVETRGRVRFGDNVTLGRQTDRTALGTEHQVLLLGMPEQTMVHFEVVSEDAERVPTWVSDADTIETLELPDYLPDLVATGTAPSWDDVLVGPIAGTVDYSLMIDNQGRIVWYDEIPAGGQLIRTSLSFDRTEMLLFMAGPRGDLSTGYVTRTALDQSASTTLPTPGVDHDMIELPHGGYAAIVVVEPPDPDEAPENSLADAIVEFDLEGKTREVWNAWDTLAPHARSNTNWTHGNALDYSAELDAYTLSMKDFNALLQVDGQSGDVNWMLGGAEEQFTYLEGTLDVPHHHQFDLVDGGVVIFDNGDSATGYSRAVELQLDLGARTAESVWSYRHDPDYRVTAKGDVHRFDDGNTQIVWSSEGEVQDVTPLGELVWQLNASAGSFVFTEHAELYRGD